MRQGLAIAFAVLVLAAPAPARAEVWEFTLDPARSRVNVVAGLNNGADGVDYGTAQAPGSDTASFGGVLQLEVGSDTVRVLEGSFADALPHPVPMQPNPGGAGPAPADYGWVGTPTPGGPAPRAAAIRDLRFEFFSEDIEYTRPDGGFPNRIRARIGSGVADYTLAGATYSFDFAGPDQIPGDDDPLAFLTTNGATQTITFPFYTTLITRFSPDAPSGDFFIFHGDITATRLVPEPTAAAIMLGLGPVLLLRRRERTAPATAPSEA